MIKISWKNEARKKDRQTVEPTKAQAKRAKMLKNKKANKKQQQKKQKARNNFTILM